MSRGGGCFEVSDAQVSLSVSLFMPPPDVELLATLQNHVCLHATMLPAMMTMD